MRSLVGCSPNAGHELRLEAVSSRPLILIEAPSSAYHRGMLVVGKVTNKRRRPHAILHQATSNVLWDRSPRPDDVHLHLEPSWGEPGASQLHGKPRDLPQGHCTLSGGDCRRGRMYVHMVLAG